MKYLFTTIVYTCFCFLSFSQDYEPEPSKPVQNKTKKNTKPAPPSTLNVKFTANHDFYLTVGKTFYGKINKDSSFTARLKAGLHNILFEEADSTGEYFESIFNITSQMIQKHKGKDTVHTVAFKPDFIDIIQPDKYNTNREGETLVLTEKQKKDRAIVSGIMADMIVVTGGSFTMGKDAGKKIVAHEVSVDGFNIGRHEITQEQWQAIMGYNKSFNQNCSTCPVENVSWTEVETFIAKLNEISPEKFRLPTEAEWEYIARKAILKEVEGSITENDLKKNRKDMLQNTVWYDDNSHKTTHPAGEKKSKLGIHDLLGNVSEWCSDFYTQDYEKENNLNPKGPAVGDNKIIKGGSFKDGEKIVQNIGLRNNLPPSQANGMIGFRLVSINQ